MPVRAVLLAAVLLAAGCLVVAGFAGFSGEAAMIVAGVLLATWGWLILGEVSGDGERG